ncbi:MAG TPA: hypothetical protein VNU66_05055 [Mycobacteriales bacterium]|nr:hypothetical protein [Mycobacteriales bacterium]
MVVPSYHYMIGPMAALLALGVIVLLCRWVFSTAPREQRQERRRAALLARGDYGLLVPVASTRTAEDAAVLRGVLTEAGVRCTVTGAEPGTWQLLVFRSDADRASALVRS